MNYIVFDLEWNQRIHGGPLRGIGEIIEIGAVKVDDTMRVTDELHIVVRPSVYEKLHPHVREIVHLDEAALEKGILFEEAAEKLRAFCGEEHKFLSWGDEDALILIQNLAYYGLPLDFAAEHYNLQKIYHQQMEEEQGKNQRGLAWCVEKLGIPEQPGEYHSALTDARYTAQIMLRLDMERAARENPGLYLPTHHQQQNYFARFRALAVPGQSRLACPACGKPTRCVEDMFSFSGTSMIVVAHCGDCGYFSSICTRRRNPAPVRRSGAPVPPKGEQAQQTAAAPGEEVKKKRRHRGGRRHHRKRTGETAVTE